MISYVARKPPFSGGRCGLAACACVRSVDIIYVNALAFTLPPKVKQSMQRECCVKLILVGKRHHMRSCIRTCTRKIPLAITAEGTRCTRVWAAEVVVETARSYKRT